MDYLKNLAEGNQNQNKQPSQGQNSNQQSSSGGGFLSGIGDKLNSAVGGGRESEKNEDMLDKGNFFPISYLAQMPFVPYCMLVSSLVLI